LETRVIGFLERTKKVGLTLLLAILLPGILPGWAAPPPNISVKKPAKKKPKRVKRLRLTVGELEFTPPVGFKVVHTSPSGIDMELHKAKVPWYMISVTSRELGNREKLTAPELHQVRAQLLARLQKPGPLKVKPIRVRGFPALLYDYSGVSGKTRLHARQVVWVREGVLTVVSCMYEEKQEQRSQHFLQSLLQGSSWGPDRI
jgi:hypothetical protein